MQRALILLPSLLLLAAGCLSVPKLGATDTATDPGADVTLRGDSSVGPDLSTTDAWVGGCCSSDAQCGLGFHCVGGHCLEGAPVGSCWADSDCLEGLGARLVTPAPVVCLGAQLCACPLDLHCDRGFSLGQCVPDDGTSDAQPGDCCWQDLTCGPHMQCVEPYDLAGGSAGAAPGWSDEEEEEPKKPGPGEPLTGACGLPPGEGECYHPSDCAPGYTCVGAVTPSCDGSSPPARGKCEADVDPNACCWGDSVCSGGMVCVYPWSWYGGPMPAGEAPPPDFHDKVAMPEGICAPPPQAGHCYHDGDCATGELCVGAYTSACMSSEVGPAPGVCQSPAAGNACCWDDTWCEAGQVCVQPLASAMDPPSQPGPEEPGPPPDRGVPAEPPGWVCAPAPAAGLCYGPEDCPAGQACYGALVGDCWSDSPTKPGLCLD